MKTVMLGLIAETAIHCGAGRSAGIIDLPVAREAATDFPFIPGSGLKGCLKDRARELGWNDARLGEVFGKSDNAGGLLLSDVRLLLLPVRSMTGTYRWVTCPLVLERYRRDLARCGLSLAPLVENVPHGEIAAALTAGGPGEQLLLEEREFTIRGACPDKLTEEIALLIRHEETRRRLPGQIAVVSDDDFTWFCRYALPVQARNKLDEQTKKSKNLWYEEACLLIPSCMHWRRCVQPALKMSSPGSFPIPIHTCSSAAMKPSDRVGSL